MSEEVTIFKKTMPELVKRVSDWFEIDLTIKLFGVKVFCFTWPPKSDKTN